MSFPQKCLSSLLVSLRSLICFCVYVRTVCMVEYTDALYAIVRHTGYPHESDCRHLLVIVKMLTFSVSVLLYPSPSHQIQTTAASFPSYKRLPLPLDLSCSTPLHRPPPPVSFYEAVLKIFP